MSESPSTAQMSSLNAQAPTFRPKIPPNPVLSRQTSDGDSSTTSNEARPPQKRDEGRKRDSKNKQKKVVDASEIFNFTYDRPAIPDSPTQQFRKSRKRNSSFTKDQYILAK
jgi:hypothetical protein